MPLDPNAVVVVIPAHNEGSALSCVLESLRQYTVVVVDDGSSDDTATIAGQQAATAPVHVLRHPINLGQGAALQTGMTYALSIGAQIIVHFDADGQHNPDDISQLVQPIIDGRADVVLGSRFLRDDDAAHVPLLKRLVLRGGVLVNGLFTGIWLSDAHNGFRALSRRAAEAIRLRENGYAHASEILSLIARHKLRFVECPTTIRYDAYALNKGQPISNSINILIDLVLHKMLR